MRSGDDGFEYELICREELQEKMEERGVAKNFDFIEKWGERYERATEGRPLNFPGRALDFGGPLLGSA